MYVQSVAKIE